MTHAAAVLLSVAFLVGCADKTSPPPGRDPVASSTATATPRLEPAPDQSKRYFQRRLIEEGDDTLGSSFAGYLSSLGLNGRELQHAPIDTAYGQARAAANRVADAARRRKILLDLFNEVEP